MRILVLNWRDPKHPRAGGAERYVDEVTKRWAEAGHNVTWFCATVDGAQAREQHGAVSIVRAGGRISVYAKARQFMRSGSWDAIVESVNTRPWFAHRIAPTVPSVAIFHQLARDVWFHEASLPVATVGRFLLEPLWLRKYRGESVVAVSESTRRDLHRARIYDATVASPGRPAAPSLSIPKEAEATFIFVGRLQASKRPDHAVSAFRLLRSQIPDAKLWIVGDGPMRHKLEASAPAGVTIFGRVDEATKWKLLARAHLLLVPSVREGWGLVVSEAAAVRTPAIGYRVSGLIDSIADGETGWLCDPNPAAMAAAVAASLPEAAHAGARARRRIEHLSWAVAAQSILQSTAAPYAALPDGLPRGRIDSRGGRQSPHAG